MSLLNVITPSLEVESLGRREKGRWALLSTRKLGHRTTHRERHTDTEVQRHRKSERESRCSVAWAPPHSQAEVENHISIRD